MKFLKFKKDGKKTGSRTVSYSREKARRITSYIIFSLIIASICFNIAFFNKYQYIRNVAAESEKNINETLQERKKTTLLNENAAIIFAEDFLNQYITIPLDSAQREQRTKDLKTLFIKEFNKDIDNTKEFTGERKITNITYIEKQVINSKLADFHFLVDYEMVIPSVQPEQPVVSEDGTVVATETPTAETQSLTRSNEIVVRLATNGKGFAVVDIPRFLDKRDLSSKVSYEEKKSFKHENLGHNEKQQIVNFLNDYFTALAENDVKQLEYMTANPRGLGNYNFTTILNGDYSKIGDTYYANVTVSMEEKDTKLQVSQHYEFVIVKKEKDFFIKTEK